jgi:hypothetical protein
MTDEPEVAEWLTRFEKKFGLNNTRQGLLKLQDARELFYEELGYNITRKQFENLASENEQRKQAEILAGVTPGTVKIGNREQNVYRNSKGQFAKKPY